MRILHLVSGSPHSGEETFAIDVIRCLQERNVEQFVLCRPHDIFLNNLRNAKVPYDKFTFAKWQKYLQSGVIQRKIKSYAPDVVHCWTRRAATFISRNCDVPTLGWYPFTPKMRCAGACDFYIGVTENQVALIKKNMGCSDRVFLITPFGKLIDDAPLSREEFGIPVDKPVILMLARMNPVKGVDILLRACVNLDVFLLLAGDGHELQNYKGLARDLGIDSRVHFTGWRTDRSALLDLADILAVPSRFEPSGTVMTEAWCKGVPVVASRTEGPLQYIEHGVNGMLSDIEDVDGLTNNLRAVLEDKGLHTRLVAGGSRTYESQFSEEIVISKLLATYEQIARRGVQA